MNSSTSISQQPEHELGGFLRYWRQQRGKSQLDLSLDTGVSQCHISFVESGRSVSQQGVAAQSGEDLIPQKGWQGTIPYQHDLERFIPLLKRDATLCRVGVGKLPTPNEYGQMTTVLARTTLAGSNTGGIRETQEMLDFCAVQRIKPQITKIPMDGINDAWLKVIAKQARYRFVIDMDVNS